MGTPLELAGAYKRTEKGNNDWYYGGGDIAWTDLAAARAGVPLAIRPGKTVGVLVNNKIVEYIWHNDDVSDGGLQPKKVEADKVPTQYSKNTVESGGVFDALAAKATLRDGVTKVGAFSLVNGNTFHISGYTIKYNNIYQSLPEADVVLPAPPEPGRFKRWDIVYINPVSMQIGTAQGPLDTILGLPVIPAGAFELVRVLRGVNNITNEIYQPPAVDFMDNNTIQTIFSDKVMDGTFYSNNDGVKFGTRIITPGRIGYPINFRNLFLPSAFVVPVTDNAAAKGVFLKFMAGLTGNVVLHYGPYVYLEGGECTIQIAMKCPDISKTACTGIYLEIVREDILVNSIVIKASSFTKSDTIAYFNLPFTAVKNGRYQFRAYPGDRTKATLVDYYLDEAVIFPAGLAPKVDITPAFDRANHTGQQLASTISDFTATVVGTVITGLSSVAGTPVNTDNLVTILSKFRYLYDNLGRLIRQQVLSQFTKTNAAVTSADTVEGAIGKLQGQIEAFGNNGEKLNTGANAGLAGNGTRALLALPDGTLVGEVNISWDANTKTFYIGQPGVPGKFFVYSTISRIQVQPDVTSGNADITFNDDQEKAFLFRSVDNKEYLGFCTINGREAVIIFQRSQIDMGVFAPLTTVQLRASTGSTNKTYFTDSTGAPFRIPMTVDGVNLTLKGICRGSNNSGTVGDQVLVGNFEVTLKRIGGTISIVGTPYMQRTVDSSPVNTFQIAAEGVADINGVANQAVSLYVISNSGLAMDWIIGKVEYF